MAEARACPVETPVSTPVVLSLGMGIESTAILATLLQRARFAPAEGREPIPLARVTLIPKGGLRLKVQLRSFSGRNENHITDEAREHR